MPPTPSFRRLATAVVLSTLAWAAPLAAQAPPSDPVIDNARFTAFLDELKTEAVERGISSAVAAKALDGLAPLPVVIERDRGQAEVVLSVDDYVRRRLTPAMVRRARSMATTHKALLD
jgi:membrane-bound lytic murein transglycosylase B